MASHSSSFSAAQLVGLSPSSASSPAGVSVQQQFFPPRSSAHGMSCGSPEAAMAAAAAAAAAVMGHQQQSPQSPPQPQLPPPPPLPLPNWAYGHPALIPVDPQTESLAENWRQFQQAAYNYNLDPHILAVYGGGGFGHPHHPHHPHSRAGDLSARRKNATRETTSILKAWLNEHKKNPYPTKGEKIMLAIITTMTLTQVSTWFANARRRLKKENKMTWVPRNRADEEDDDEFDAVGSGGGAATATASANVNGDAANDDGDDPDDGGLDDIDVESAETPPPMPPPPQQPKMTTQQISSNQRKRPYAPDPADHGSPPGGVVAVKSKPRIWSIVDTLNRTEPAPTQPPHLQRHHAPTAPLPPPPLQQIPQPPQHHQPQLHHHGHPLHHPSHPIPLGFFPHPGPPAPPPLLMPPPPLYYSLFSAFNRAPQMAAFAHMPAKCEDSPKLQEQQQPQQQ